MSEFTVRLLTRQASFALERQKQETARHGIADFVARIRH
jgi:hypothetical protein